ncbi:MAG TPA: carboxypeptidase-like regulatory domain-containing protein, partial [Pyrinomonadaceae bacterium]
MKKLPVLFLAAIFLIVSAAAQSPTRTISGVVKDPNGAVIAGARIFLSGSRGRPQQSAVTDENGVFGFANLPPDNYEIRVSAEGFASQAKPVQVTADAISNLEFVLQIGESRV